MEGFLYLPLVNN